MNSNYTLRRKITLLDNSTILKIAAGEVIERPASILKELVENSIDAGATQIEIKILDGGITMIEVSDNGCGIPYHDLELAFMNHATSKISSNSLEDIMFLGFRGEALASIRATARAKIVSRTLQQDQNSNSAQNAWSIVANGDEIGNLCPEYRKDIGTTITIHDVFCFTPNRLRFLSSKQSENACFMHLIDNLALANHHISFKMFIDGKNVIDVPQHTEKSERIARIMGNEFWDDSVLVNSVGRYIKIFGYITTPSSAFKKGKIITFVNCRIVSDQRIVAIIKAAYKGLIDNKTNPSAVLFLEIDHRCIDVNIHPHKTKVKFSDEQLMKDELFKAIRESLRKTTNNVNIFSQIIEENIAKKMEYERYNAYQTSLINQKNHIQSPNNFFLNEEGNNLYKANNRGNKMEMNIATQQSIHTQNFNKKYIDKNSNLDHNIETLNNQQNFADDIQSHIQIITDMQSQPQESHKSIYSNVGYTTKLGMPLYQISNLYIVSIVQEENALVIVDQHAAHERIILQSIKKQMSNLGYIPKQLLLFPETINIAQSAASLISEYIDLLSKFGIDLVISTNTDESFSLLINSIPSIFGGISSAYEMVNSIIHEIIHQPFLAKEVTQYAIDKVCGEIACYSSIRGGRKMNIDEMTALLRLIEEEDFTSQCNHGRPTYVKFDEKFIAKFFDR